MTEKNNNNVFMKSTKFRTIFPFYISEVNQKFFIDLANHENKTFLKKVLPKLNNEFEEEELEVLNQIENLTRPEKIMRMINLSLAKIVALTGTKKADLFKQIGVDEFKQPLYIRTKNNFTDLEILGDIHEERRFSYSIDINENSYLYELVEQIQFGFYLDYETNKISGGFSLNSGNKYANMNFEDSIEKTYLNYLTKKFLKSQLYPLSLDNILNIAYDVSGNKFFKNKKTNIKKNKKEINIKKDLDKIINFDNVTIDEIKDNWDGYIERKYLKFKDFDENQEIFYKDQLFFSLLIVCLIMLNLLQEINKYFTSDNPEIILSLLNKPEKLVDNEDQSYTEDFNSLIQHIYENSIGKTNDNIKINQIKNAKDFVQMVSNYVDVDYQKVALQEFVSTYEILPEEKTMVLNKNDFLNNPKFRTYFTMLLFPEIYSIGINNPVLIEYLHLKNIVNNDKDIKTSDALLDDVSESICELNYDYSSFINDDTIVIVKNNEPLYTIIEDEKILITRDENRRIYNHYFWAEIYVKSKVSEKDYIERSVNKLFNTEVKNKTIILKEAMKNLENLQFDWFDHFYGLTHIKKIVKKLDEESNLKDSIDILSKKLKQEDAITKKSWERSYISLGFISALVIGLIDFISMVFTVLPNSDTPVRFSILYAFIGIGSALAIILVFTLVVSVITILRIKKKVKEIDNKYWHDIK